MSVNKIKANYAEFDGEYVHITRVPMRPLWFLGGAVVGAFMVAFLIDPVLSRYGFNEEYYQYRFLAYILFIAFSGIVFVLFAGEKEEYLVPKVDILTMKKYPESRKVTLVVDDERTKRRQPVAVKK